MEERRKINLNEVEKVKRFVNQMSTFESDVDIVSRRQIVDAKSIMGVFSFDLSELVEVQLISDDEEEIRRFNEVIKEFM